MRTRFRRDVIVQVIAGRGDADVACAAKAPTQRYRRGSEESA